jgi:hypothetical protein
MNFRFNDAPFLLAGFILFMDSFAILIELPLITIPASNPPYLIKSLFFIINNQLVGGPKSEVRSPKTEVRRPKTEDRSPKTEVRSPKSEDRSPKTEVRS